jgi:hypothetical protein
MVPPMFPFRFPLSGRHFAIIDGCSGFGLSLGSLIRSGGGYVSLLGRDEDHLHEAACTLHGARIVLRRGDPLRDLSDLLQGAAPVDYLLMPAAIGGACQNSDRAAFAPGSCRISDLVAKALQLTPPTCQISLLGPEEDVLEDDLLKLLAEHGSVAPILMLDSCEAANIASTVLQQLLSRRVRLQLLRGRMRLEEPNE